MQAGTGSGKKPKSSGGKAGGKARNENDPHLCLECGKELARGRLSYKKRHWEQTHKGEKTDIFKRMIVPINHEKARSLLRERASKNRGEVQKNILSILLWASAVVATYIV